MNLGACEVLRATEKALFVYRLPDKVKLWLPRSAVDAASPVTAFARQGDRGDLHVEDWFARNEGLQAPGAGLRPIGAVAKADEPTAGPVLKPAPELSEDQQEALDAVLRTIDAAAAARDPSRRVLCLTGPAGTGKTTLLIEVARAQRRPVVLGTPTGKAASRAHEVTGLAARTLHSLLFAHAERDSAGTLRFGEPHAPCPEGGLLIVDEASMVTKKLHEEMLRQLPRGAVILYVGDREQLPPVGDSWGAPFATPTAALTKVHRQAEGSAIVRVATAIREARPAASAGLDDSAQIIRGATTSDAVGWLRQRRTEGIDATLITWTNRTRRELNDSVRDALGLRARNGVLGPGDRLLVCRNSYRLGVMNGEVYDVAEVNEAPMGPYMRRMVEAEGDDGFGGGLRSASLLRVAVTPERPELTVLPDLIGASGESYWNVIRDLKPGGAPPARDDFPDHEAWLRARQEWSTAWQDWRGIVEVDYGECLTAHKSQGSEWKEVGVVLDSGFRAAARRDPTFARRFLYTAVTRARKRLVIWSVS